MTTLNIGMLEEFKAFLDERGMPHRAGRGGYQVLQVYLENAGWSVVFRKDGQNYLTANKNLVPMVQAFLAEWRAKKNPDFQLKVSKHTKAWVIDSLVQTVEGRVFTELDVINTDPQVTEALKNAIATYVEEALKCRPTA